MTDPVTTAGAAARIAIRFKPWKVVGKHDRLARAEYEDLTSWAEDDRRKEADLLKSTAERLAGKAMLSSGQYGLELEQVRDEYARRWRDRKRTSDRLIEELRAEEGLAEKAWRWRRPFPINPDAELVAELSAAWESEQLRSELIAEAVEKVAIR